MNCSCQNRRREILLLLAARVDLGVSIPLLPTVSWSKSNIRKYFLCLAKMAKGAVDVFSFHLTLFVRVTYYQLQIQQMLIKLVASKTIWWETPVTGKVPPQYKTLSYMCFHVFLFLTLYEQWVGTEYITESLRFTTSPL